MPDEMSKSDASRIQSSQTTGGKDTGAGSFAARAQSAGDRNTNGPSSSTGSKSGSGGGQGGGGGASSAGANKK
ncbi:MAG: hypothetical protein M1831_001313 [Alyxoria varia]|nr:MAG: hypothetical protein M1831_001313 [Alyxoria varia]